MTAPPTLRLSPLASVAERDGEAVVLDLSSGRYFTANATGTVLLRRLREGAHVGDLTEALVQAFAVDEGTARRDALAWVARLEERGLLAKGPSA